MTRALSTTYSGAWCVGNTRITPCKRALLCRSLASAKDVFVVFASAVAEKVLHWSHKSKQRCLSMVLLLSTHT